MRIQQDISGCLAGTIGEYGISDSEFTSAIKRAEDAVSRVRSRIGEGRLDLALMPGKTDDLQACARAAEILMAEGTRDIIILGTGGSSLGAQALAQIAGYKVSGVIPFHNNKKRIRLHFLDNLDAWTLDRTLEDQDLKRSKFLVISKSGGTSETTMQMLVVLETLKKIGLDWNAPSQMVVITGTEDPENNPVLQLANRHKLLVLEHETGIGGRYSVLSNVGMLPAMLMELEPRKIRDGAANAIAPILNNEPVDNIPAAIGAAVNIALMENNGIAASVIMPYCERLRLFSTWFQQLWAESLCKDGKGTTPIASAGPVDQHSLMQMFLDGPRDKLINVIQLPTAKTGFKIPASYKDDELIGYLAGRTIGDMTDCQQRATVATLISNQRPVRVFKMDWLDGASMGELMMHFMLETILTGFMLGIDPFNQPAVEQSKILTRECLAQL